jgi:hypothetical protein
MTVALPKVDDKWLLDMHVHVGPEYLKRRYTPRALVEEGRRAGFGAVMKNHFQPTTSWVSLTARPDEKVKFAGAVVLNATVGGVDAHGVRAAMSGWKADVRAPDPRRGGAVVWLPTLFAEAHLNLYDRRELSEAWGVKPEYSRHVPVGEGFALDEDDGRIMAGVDRMLRAVAENDLVLATGHLDARETVAVVRRAHDAGIRRILMTHPLFQSTNQTVDVLVRLWRQYGAYSELAFSNIAMDHLTWEQYLEVIEAVGSEGVVLTTDLGQVMNPSVADGWRQYVAELRKRSVKDDDIARMSVLNPHRILYDPALVSRA